ncbi:MAG: SDR family oxidoreductase [Pseudomonadota bacterium]
MSDSEQERPGDPPGLLHVLVLGGYGLIGAAIVRRLMAEGHKVTAIGRSDKIRNKPQATDWHFFNIGRQSVGGWRAALSGVDAVVNASGALQDGARDNLTAIHETALAQLGEALQGSAARVVQISAAGVSDQASTAFFRSKARGEAALVASGVDVTILRPTLVIAPTAYGGTALLRAAASMPWILPKVLPNTRVQCVHIDDLTAAVVDAVEGRLATNAPIDVTGADTVALPDLLSRMRRWMGFDDAKLTPPVPSFAIKALSFVADVAGHLGWRAPLRSTAVTVLRDGVTGDATALARAGGNPCRALDEVFATLPATTQDRWFARAFLLLSIAILTLSLFWIVSGLIALWHPSSATQVLSARGMPAAPALTLVIGGAILDIALGAAVLIRRWAKHACQGMILLSLAYLAGAIVFAPDLWADPLGPMVKVVPTIVLTLFTLAFLDDR